MEQLINFLFGKIDDTPDIKNVEVVNGKWEVHGKRFEQLSCSERIMLFEHVKQTKC